MNPERVRYIKYKRDYQTCRRAEKVQNIADLIPARKKKEKKKEEEEGERGGVGRREGGGEEKTG